MPEKKVLIITYYWPPSGGSGVQRWLKFVKYLPMFGYKPFVFTPENPAFAVQDNSLLKDIPSEAEIIRFPIWEPYELFLGISRIFGGRKVAKPTEFLGTKKSFLHNVSVWVRGNLFIPDPRIFWVKPSVKFLNDFIIKNEIHTIITTGPPHSMHLIGLALKEKNKALRWLADFRDPWSEWGLLDSLSVIERVRNMHRKLELKVLQNADEVITITPFYMKRFEALSGRKIQLLTNGFDEDDFTNLVYKKSNNFLIRHIGIVNEKCNPRPFLNAVVELMRGNADFRSCVRIEFIGDVNHQIKDYVHTSPELSTIVMFKGNIPHAELVAQYGESSLLVLILTGYRDAGGYMPGKLFEYLATGLPILATGPTTGDASVLLNETQAGKMIDSANITGMVAELLKNFESWRQSETPIVKRSNGEQYTRRMITRDLARLI